MVNYNWIYIIIFLFMGYMFYLDLVPEAKGSSWIKGRSLFFEIARFIILLALIIICLIVSDFIFNFQKVYPEPDSLRYRGVLIFTTVMTFSFWGLFVTIIWGSLLGIKLAITYVKWFFKLENPPRKDFKRLIKSIYEMDENNKDKYLILNELKHVGMIIFVTVLIMWMSTAIIKGYFEVKNTQTLYDLLIEKSIVNNPEAYSFSDFKVTLSYLIKDLSFYVSFFNVLILSFMLPLGYKLIFNVKNKK